jgi:5-methylcytosine-specific restriction endonuclease McrA
VVDVKNGKRINTSITGDLSMTLQDAISSSNSMAEAAKKLDMPFMTFKRRAVELGVYKTNQGGKGSNKGRQYHTADILLGNHPSYKTSMLKKRLVTEGILVYNCTSCGMGDEWNGDPIVLQLDHINGIHDDHRLENLRLLCPNCHSQTDTWCGRNVK